MVADRDLLKSESRKVLHEDRPAHPHEWGVISNDFYAILRGEKAKGGEGVVHIHGVRKGGSGYWIVTLFSARGRPLAFIPMLIYTAYTTFIVCCLQQYRDWVEDPRQVKVWSSLTTALSLVGVALFFLQTFRTNNSYRCWADGRMQLGIFNAEVESIVSFIAGGAIQSRRYSRRVLRWCAAMIEIVKCDLRNEDNLVPVEVLLTQEELQDLKDAPPQVRWLYCSQMIQMTWGQAFDDRLIGMNLHKSFPDMIGKIHISVSSMFRIQNTPMPFAYVTHLRSFLVIWMSMLPFVFINGLGYFAIAICFMIAYSLLGMEAISLEIESPFGRDFNDLPMDNLSLAVLKTLFWAYGQTSRIPSDGKDDPEPPEWAMKSKPASPGRSELKHHLMVIEEDRLHGFEVPLSALKTTEGLQTRPSDSRGGWHLNSQVVPAASLGSFQERGLANQTSRVSESVGRSLLNPSNRFSSSALNPPSDKI